MRDKGFTRPQGFENGGGVTANQMMGATQAMGTPRNTQIELDGKAYDTNSINYSMGTAPRGLASNQTNYSMGTAPESSAPDMASIASDMRARQEMQKAELMGQLINLVGGENPEVIQILKDAPISELMKAVQEIQEVGGVVTKADGGPIRYFRDGGEADGEDDRKRLGIDSQGRMIPYGQPGSKMPSPSIGNFLQQTPPPPIYDDDLVPEIFPGPPGFLPLPTDPDFVPPKNVDDIKDSAGATNGMLNGAGLSSIMSSLLADPEGRFTTPRTPVRPPDPFIDNPVRIPDGPATIPSPPPVRQPDPFIDNPVRIPDEMSMSFVPGTSPEEMERQNKLFNQRFGPSEPVFNPFQTNMAGTASDPYGITQPTANQPQVRPQGGPFRRPPRYERNMLFGQRRDR